MHTRQILDSQFGIFLKAPHCVSTWALQGVKENQTGSAATAQSKIITFLQLPQLPP